MLISSHGGIGIRFCVYTCQNCQMGCATLVQMRGEQQAGLIAIPSAAESQRQLNCRFSGDCRLWIWICGNFSVILQAKFLMTNTEF